MVSTAPPSFSVAASVAPIKMWSNSYGNMYLRVQNSFLDFYTDETKEREAKGKAIYRSRSADGAIDKSNRGGDAVNSMSDSTRSCSNSESNDEERDSVESVQAQAQDLPRDLMQRRVMPSARAPEAEIPALQTTTSEIFADMAPPSTAWAESPQNHAASSRSQGFKRNLQKLRGPPGSVVTTVMIRGIPCSLSKTCMMKILDDAGFLGKYDFFYLPNPGSANGNLGYAFVNFIHPMYATVCKASLHGVSLDPVRSAKVCTVNPADIQGLNNLRKHFRRTAVSRSGHGPVFLKAALGQM